jgi:hypothetical protein
MVKVLLFLSGLAILFVSSPRPQSLRLGPCLFDNRADRLGSAPDSDGNEISVLRNFQASSVVRQPSRVARGFVALANLRRVPFSGYCPKGHCP